MALRIVKALGVLCTLEVPTVLETLRDVEIIEVQRTLRTLKITKGVEAQKDPETL